jgi:dihydrofolate reductase
MRRIVVNEWMTLDGVVQAPGYPDEDTSGGFTQGGWHMPYLDDKAREWIVAGYQQAGGFLFGRRTYEQLASYWPHASDEEQGVAKPLNTLPKYVASRTLSEPLEWENSTLLNGDLGRSVAALKGKQGGDLHVVGSSDLTRQLMELDLIDEFRLMIDPLLLGGGKRIFGADGVPRRLRLADQERVTTGAILATYTVDRERN